MSAPQEAPTFTYVLTCRQCGHELNRAVGVPQADKSQVVIAAPLMAGHCQNGCRSTWSDCNLRWNGTWYPDADAPPYPVAARRDMTGVAAKRRRQG